MSFEKDIYNKNRERVQAILENFKPGQVQEVLEDLLQKGGKKATIGEIRTHGGKQMQKTPSGWVPVKTGAKSGKSTETSGKHIPNTETSKAPTKNVLELSGFSQKEFNKLHRNQRRNWEKVAEDGADGLPAYRNIDQSRDHAHVVVNDWGARYFNEKGQQHRDGDKPAWTTDGGSKRWVKNGEFHRDDDKPSWESEKGRDEFYHKNGVAYVPDHKKAADENNNKASKRKHDKAHQEVSEYFKDNDIELTKDFSLADFAKETHLSLKQSTLVLCNLEDEKVMKEIAKGDYENFDIDDSSIFNDSYHDMMEDHF